MGRTKKQQRGSTSAAAPAETGNEKEKRAETGRDGGRLERLRAREHRKEAALEEGGAAAPAAGEQFFKVFFPEQSGDRLVTFSSLVHRLCRHYFLFLALLDAVFIFGRYK
jgi:hypothetical protein